MARTAVFVWLRYALYLWCYLKWPLSTLSNPNFLHILWLSIELYEVTGNKKSKQRSHMSYLWWWMGRNSRPSLWCRRYWAQRKPPSWAGGCNSTNKHNVSILCHHIDGPMDQGNTQSDRLIHRETDCRITIGLMDGLSFGEYCTIHDFSWCQYLYWKIPENL